MDRRTLLKSLPLGLVAPHLAPLVARAEAEAQGAKPMRFVFVIIDNGLWPDHVMPAGFKRQEMKNPLHGLNGGGGNPINGADELIDLPLGGPDLPLFEGLAPLQKHIDRVTLLTGLSGRVAGGGHSNGYGTLGAYLYRNAAPPSDITIDAALAKASPAIRPLVALGLHNDPGPNCPPMFDGISAYGPNQKVTVIQDPLLAHKVLFGKLVDGNARQEVGSQSLLLDAVANQIRQIQSKFSVDEGQKLERTADAFAAIAKRQSRLGEIDPTRIPAVRPDFHGSLSVPTRLAAHVDLATTALIIGLTNTVTLCPSNLGQFYPSWKDIGVAVDIHEGIGHAGRQPEAVAARVKIRQYITGQIAKMVDTLKSVPEGSGTMMDNTLIVCLSDAAEDHHSTCMEWPMVLVGNLGGRLKLGGRFINVPKYGAKGHATVAQFYTALLHAAGKPVDHFGTKDNTLLEAGLSQKEPWTHVLA